VYLLIYTVEKWWNEILRNLNAENNNILTQLRILIQQNNYSILGLVLGNALILCCSYYR